MRTSLLALAISALFLGSLPAIAADDATPKAPDAKAGMRLKLQAYDGNEKEPEKMHFQINTLDLHRQPAEFLEIGDTISHTTFKLVKFVFKEAPNAKGGIDNVSELTIVNTATNEKFVLVWDKITVVR